MFETERRSAISSSELGLYSDRADRYNRNNYGFIIRKFVIVVMAIVAVILAGIFIYDFAAGASASSKVSQETKHIYILQNALKKSNYLTKKTTTTTTLTPLLSSDLQKRSDDDVQQLGFIDNDDDNNNNNNNNNNDEKKRNFDIDLPEMRGQSLENFKLRKKLLQPNEVDEGDGEVEVKQTVKNHAVVYRVKQMYKPPKDNEKESTEETKPAPFHFEFRAPRPEAFKRPKFPQLTQYRYPQSSKNIQDIIKYLAHDPDATKRGIKFTGVYMNPQKYDRHSEIGETMSNSDKAEYSSYSQNSEEDNEDEEENKEENNNENYQYSQQTIGDSFFPYKPRHPADVNLLAPPASFVPSNVRFSQEINRHHPYIESYHHRPMLIKPQTQIEQSYETSALQSSNYGKKKSKPKPKPFSVMLDIYPMTELNDQSITNNQKISTRPKNVINTDDYIDSRRPGGIYGRGGRFYPGNFAVPTQPIPIVAIPTNDPTNTDDDEKQQMIFHLNLYPRKKNNKQNRNDAVQRSEIIHEDSQENLMKNIMLPFNTITKQLAVHSAIENAKFENNEELNDENKQTKNYQENELKNNNE
ncbi:probable WRKY transcription factor protein 1 [Aphidius gifuensis]|uniref:probable WRKY transcription factor protein 1 n=1 Tax=Aphidius gifuensis TaxID=684658 RepID=UPI001CDCDC61|nr:probable WRKY transcription factor protein 1 [Aphidius gifuensis]